MEVLYGSPYGYFILISFKISQKSHHANDTTYEYSSLFDEFLCKFFDTSVPV
jgi:hypothetical protein